MRERYGNLISARDAHLRFNARGTIEAIGTHAPRTGTESPIDNRRLTAYYDNPDEPRHRNGDTP